MNWVIGRFLYPFGIKFIDPHIVGELTKWFPLIGETSHLLSVSYRYLHRHEGETLFNLPMPKRGQPAISQLIFYSPLFDKGVTREIG
jgi:hypothetical protein